MSTLKSKYDTNFTAGGLLFHEFLALKPLILSEDFEHRINEEVGLNEVLALKKHTARERVVYEIKRRVASTDIKFWDAFYSWTEKEQRLGLFFLCLKTYRLIFDLHWDMARSKYYKGDNLNPYDITMAFDELASKNKQVATWSSTTLDKLNVQYRKVLNDAGLLKDDRLIKPLDISNTFWSYFKENNEAWFLEACFIA